MKKFLKIMFFINIVVIAVFCVFFFKNEVSGLIYYQTGIVVNIPEIKLGNFVFNKNENSASAVFTEQVTENEKQENKELSEVEKYLSSLDGNVVIGINYSMMSSDPSVLAGNAERIVKAKIRAVKTVAYSNMVYSEITARVKKTYKGQETDEIQIYSLGGMLDTVDLKDGQIKNTVEKVSQAWDKVNVEIDFFDAIEEGKEYIIFADNHNGILSPVNGNSSFFKIEGRNVKRLSAKGDNFSMKLSKFEKEYL